MAVEVTQLFVYPIKGMGGIALNSAEIGPLGLDYDRQFMLVDENGVFISQRSQPVLSQFICRIDHNTFTVSYLTDSIELSLRDSAEFGNPLEVEVWGARFAAKECDADYSKWFSEHLGQPVKLVRHSGVNSRVKKKEYADLKMRFPDGYPILVATEESLNDLNSYMASSVPMNRFRPNIVVKGIAAWDEFHQKGLQNAKASLLFAKPCERCVVTTIDQATGIKQGKDPLKTLVEINGSPALFGMNAYSEDSFTLKIGENLELL